MTGISRRISRGRALAVFLVAAASMLGALILSPSFTYAACPAGTHDSGSMSNHGLENCVPDDPNDTSVHQTVQAQETSPSPGPNLAAAGLAAVLAPFVLVAWVIFKIGSLLLGLAGFIFNWAVMIVVFQFATYLGNSPGMLIAWSILRDFGNIVLLFGFVFVGISTILDLHSYPWKKTLPLLVIFAVLLNFSLFAAEAVIDSTNVLSATLYNQAYQPGLNCSTTDLTGCIVNTGVAGQILDKIQIATVYQDSDAQSGGDAFSFIGSVLSYAGDPLPFLLKFIALALVVMTAAVVLFAGAFMLISRGVILAFLMVTSPIGFAGMAIPGLNKIAHDWWHKLINQALFAPVFLILILVALKMTDGLDALATQTGGIAAAISANNAIQTGPLFLFALIIGFMIGALLIAKQFGIYGADFVTKQATGVIAGTAGVMTAGTAGWLGRNTVGRFANQQASRLALSRFGTNTLIGRGLAGVAGYGAKASFDARGGSSLLGKRSDAAKGGFAGVQDAKKKTANEIAKGRSDAWKAEDASFKQKSKELQENADFERSRGNDAKAADLENQKKQNEKDWEAAQMARLDPKDRALYKWRKDNGKLTDQEATQETESRAKFAEAATNLRDATTGLAAAEARLADARSRQAAAPKAFDGTTPHDTEVHNAQLERERLNAEKNHWQEQRDAADKQLKALQALKEKRGAEAAAEFTDPKRAMEQLAKSYERLSRSPAAVVLDGASLRSLASAVRKDMGKSHADHVLEELKDMMGGHGGSHGKADEGGGGGGGHDKPHTPTAAPDKH